MIPLPVLEEVIDRSQVAARIEMLLESVRNFVRRGGRQERFRRSQGVA